MIVIYGNILLNPCSGTEQLTQQEAIAIQAFSKLLKLRRDWVGTWEPNWSEGTIRKYYIYFYQNKFFVDYHYDYSRAFSFPTKEMRDAFYENFKELIEKCKELL